MSSAVRTIEKQIMKRGGYTREKWYLGKDENGQPKIFNVRRGGEITDMDDTPIGRHWPARIPSRIKAPTKPQKRPIHNGRGSRRGKHSKAWIEARKAPSA